MLKQFATGLASGELEAMDVGGEYRISRADLNDFIQRRKTGKNRQKD